MRENSSRLSARSRDSPDGLKNRIGNDHGSFISGVTEQKLIRQHLYCRLSMERAIDKSSRRRAPISPKLRPSFVSFHIHLA
jgi:hypothetical protein